MHVSGPLHVLADLLLEKNPDNHRKRSWVGPGASLDVWEQRKNLCPCWDSNPRSSSLYPSNKTDYSALLKLKRHVNPIIQEYGILNLPI